MIRRAILGLVLSVAVVVVVLLLLGFRPRDMANIYRKPYVQALQDGDYLDGMTIWVDGNTAAGERPFQLKVHNPTPRDLTLKGSWSEAPERYEITPAEVEVTVPPRESLLVDGRLTVTAPGGVPVTRFKPPVLKGEWTWTRLGAEGEASEVVHYPVEAPLTVRRAFGTANYVVLGLYLLAMLVIGFFCAGRVTSTRSYFIANGKLPYMVAALSILGTYLSALTMMALPGMSYGVHDWTYTVQLPCLVITAVIITGLVLPRFRAAGIVSVYQYLEQRIHVSARLIASISFIIFGVGRMGLVLYLPALAFSTVTGTPLWISILAMGLVTTIYTAMGGIEAVAWTDVVQVIVFTAGAFFTLGFIFYKVSPTTFVDVGLEYNKFRTVIPSFDVTKITTLWLILETIFQTIRIYGTQQDMAQRYLTTESTAKANRSVWIAILGYIPLGFLFYFLGTALFVFYKANPEVNMPGKADPMYPHFIVNHLPVGIAGFVIAAIFAAAMSSIDSVMNSASTVCVEDFYKRLSKKPRTDEQYLRIARRLTWLWGAASIGMALLFMEIQYAQIVWGQLMGIATNGVLGLMALAFLPIRINKWAAAAGFAFSYVCLFVMMAVGVNFLLWPVVGNTLCFLVALFLNPLFGEVKRMEADELRA